MTSLSEAHAHWHMQQRAGIISRYAMCPLDCFESEADAYSFEDEEAAAQEGNVTCGHCGERKRSVEHVRSCAKR